MGLLDEAIRQHLELKRQHGASDEELHMQEQEALGPVRREPADVPPPPTEDAGALPEALHEEAEPAYDEPAGAVGSDVPEREETAGELLRDPSEEVSGEGFDEPIDSYHEPPVAEDDRPTEAFTPEPDPEPAPGGDTPSRGFAPVEEPVPPDGAPEGSEEGDDDVLEETPEFLQETPEHDRLWFEQKPPRDFDFDE